MILARRNNSVVINRLVMSVAMGACCYFVFAGGGVPIDMDNYKLPTKSNLKSVQDAVYNEMVNLAGSIFVLLFFVVLANSLPYILVFAIERPVFIREYSNGLYSILPYYLVKIVADLPVNLITPLLQLPFVFWSVPYDQVPAYGSTEITKLLPFDVPTENPGFINPGKSFFLMYLALALGAINGLSWAMLIGAYAPNLVAATVFGQMVIIPFVLFSGIMVNMMLVPSWIRWV